MSRNLLSLMLVFISACSTPLIVSYRTPEETFRTWKAAVERLDIDAIAACYSDAARGNFKKEVKTSSTEGLKSMQKETKETEFQIQKIVFDENKAYLRVERKRKGQREIEVVTMVKEGAEWKLLP